MPRVTIGVGVLLTVLGLIGYFVVAKQSSITALIPAFFGVPLLVIGALAFKGMNRAVTMHLAAAIALLGFVGALMRPVMKTVKGESVDWTASPVVMQLIMAAICLVFVVLCVRSFMSARRSATGS